MMRIIKTSYRCWYDSPSEHRVCSVITRKESGDFSCCTYRDVYWNAPSVVVVFVGVVVRVEHRAREVLPIRCK